MEGLPVEKSKSVYFRGVCMGFALGIALSLAAQKVAEHGFAESWPWVLGSVGVAVAVALSLRES